MYSYKLSVVRDATSPPKKDTIAIFKFKGDREMFIKSHTEKYPNLQLVSEEGIIK